MTHYPTIDSLLPHLDAHPDRDGVIRTTAEAGRLVAKDYERAIYSIAHITGVDISVFRRGGLFDVTFYLTVEGPSPSLARFLRELQSLER